MILRFEIGVSGASEGFADWDNVPKLGIEGHPRLVKVAVLWLRRIEVVEPVSLEEE